MTLAIDGTAGAVSAGASTLSVSLTTQNAGDWIFVWVCSGITINGISGAGLTWETRKSVSASGNYGILFYAYAADALADAEITITFSTSSYYEYVAAWGVSGSVGAGGNPFDDNASLPAVATEYATSIAGVSTASANTMIIGAIQCFSGNVAADTGAGWSALAGSSPSTPTAFVTAQIFSSAQTDLTVPFTFTNGETIRLGIADAIVAGSAPSITAYPFRKQRTYLGR